MELGDNTIHFFLLKTLYATSLFVSSSVMLLYFAFYLNMIIKNQDLFLSTPMEISSTGGLFMFMILFGTISIIITFKALKNKIFTS